MPPGAVVPARMRRAARGRVVAGVARGLAVHLRVPVLWVRLAFVALTIANGVGLLLYAAFWVVVPQEKAASQDDPGRSVAVRVPERSRRSIVLLGGLVALGLLIGLAQLHVIGSLTALGPLLFCVVGGALIWSQADELQQGAGTGGRPVRLPFLPDAVPGLQISRRSALTLLGGLVLVVAGLIGFLAVNHELAATRDGLVVTGVIVGGVGLVSAPWWWRLANELAEERRVRIRTQERADLAAHVHDSVLHTLAMIQRNAGDEREVVRLARGQERELRSWLYQPTGRPEETLAAALGQAAAEVEDSFAVTVEPVVVGDAPMTEPLAALVQAVREAMVNAGKHAGVREIALYAEAEPELVTAFVRDRGQGFDPETVSADRHGISGSIVDRITRHGGQATVDSAPGAGTEVRLTMPLPGR